MPAASGIWVGGTAAATISTLAFGTDAAVLCTTQSTSGAGG